MKTFPTPSQPTISDLDWSMLRKYPTSSWSRVAGHSPIVAINYSDGTSQGNGYMEVWINNKMAISGSSAVRQSMHVSSSDNTLAKATVRVERASGVAHGLRQPDALEPRGDDRWAAARTDGRQTLDSIRWLENVQQSTELLGDPGRCIHISDRESDIYELFCAARKAGTHFLIRTCVDRLAGAEITRSPTKWTRSQSKDCIAWRLGTATAIPTKAVLEIRYLRIRVLPPIGKQKRYPALILTVIHAEERGAPKNRIGN